MSIPVRVEEIVQETPSIRSLRLVRCDGQPFAGYRAGGHVDVVGPTGIVRQYSVCSPPRDPSSITIAVKLETPSRGGSAALHQLEVGKVVRVSEPRNLLGVVEDPRVDRHLLFGGGIGITPLLSIAYELAERGSDFVLHYFARSTEEMAFRDLLLTEVAFRDKVRMYIGVTVDEQLDLLTEQAAACTPTTQVYICGPHPFMDQVTQSFVPVVGDDQVHVEHFVAAEIDTASDVDFVVELDTGEVLEIPADRSIVDVMLDQGINVVTSCEQGICGSCVSDVLEGTPDHRDSCLTPAEQAAGNQMALCVSRSLSRKLIIRVQ